MRKTPIIPGTKFAGWTVLRELGRRGHNMWVLCRCECGYEKGLAFYTIRSGESRRCRRCANKASTPSKTHGSTLSPEHRAWSSMHARAGKKPYYLNIKIAPEWCGKNGFATFLAHIGFKPTRTHEIDRINGLGNYEPGNVRWVTHKDQMRNVSFNVRLIFNGENKTLTEWSEITGIALCTLMKRRKLGWSVEDTLTKPVASRPKRLKPNRGGPTAAPDSKESAQDKDHDD